MPDDFNKNTSIEDEIEKSLQKMVEEETTVAKAYVGNADDYKAELLLFIIHLLFFYHFLFRINSTNTYPVPIWFLKHIANSLSFSNNSLL
jgi:hypothetical protein